MDLHVPVNPVRFVTAASLFDGHDAAINIMRRILQSQGAEVVHLGHNRSVDDVVTAALEEDVQGVAVSSYQGGHVEYFTYLVERLRDVGAGHVRVYGGGGGVIVASEVAALADLGVTIFTPEDGQRLGLAGMINVMIGECDVDLADGASIENVLAGDRRALARLITVLEAGRAGDELVAELGAAAARRTAPVLGITGTGGSGKSSLTDELVRRFRLDLEDKLSIAVLAVDPTRRKGGGALLGDRIRMNSIGVPNVYFRSMATRGAVSEVPPSVPVAVAACQAAGYDLVIVETPGIGQGDAGIVPLVDVPIYVMTPEFGAASQLEKIDMLDFAEAVVINKFERRGAEDALRDVRRQVVRNRELFGADPESLPVFGTIASRFNDDGVTALYHHLKSALGLPEGTLASPTSKVSTAHRPVVPPNRSRYLADVAETVRSYHRTTAEQAAIARRRQQLAAVRELVAAEDTDTAVLDRLHKETDSELGEADKQLLAEWPATVESYASQPTRTSLSGSEVPKVALPSYQDDGELLQWLR